MEAKQQSNPSQTALVITLGFLVIYLISKQPWALYTSLGVGVAASMSSYLAAKIEWLWMKLAWVLSLIMPNVLLSLVFYLILTPIAWLSRLFGASDPLQLKNNTDSLFKNVEKPFEKKQFEQPW